MGCKKTGGRLDSARSRSLQTPGPDCWSHAESVTDQPGGFGQVASQMCLSVSLLLKNQIQSRPKTGSEQKAA